MSCAMILLLLLQLSGWWIMDAAVRPMSCRVTAFHHLLLKEAGWGPAVSHIWSVDQDAGYRGLNLRLYETLA